MDVMMLGSWSDVCQAPEPDTCSDANDVVSGTE